MKNTPHHRRLRQQLPVAKEWEEARYKDAADAIARRWEARQSEIATSAEAWGHSVEAHMEDLGW